MKKLMIDLIHNLYILRNKTQNLVDQPHIVLLYHRINDLKDDPQLLSVSLKNFEAHIKYLKNNFLIERFENLGQGKKPSVAITFDDGYEDNYLNALPLLEKYNVPATFFITSNYLVSNKEFWWDEIERLILKNKYQNDIYLNINNIKIIFRLKTNADRLNTYGKLHLICKELTPENIDKILTEIRHKMGISEVGRKTHRAMCISQLKKLASHPLVTIGAHTLSHPKLSKLTYFEQKNEIYNSKKNIEKILNTEIKVFSYPFGTKNDYNHQSLKICLEQFDRVAANFPGQFHSWSNEMTIPRHLVRNWNIDEFKDKFLSFFYL